MAFASSLDQGGPIAQTMRDTAIMLKSMAGHDAKDSTSVDAPVPDYESFLTKGVKGLKVGVPKEYRVEGMSQEIDALWQKGIDWLRAAGARWSTSACRTRSTRFRLTTSSPPQRPRRTSRAMTACATACACPARMFSTPTRTPAPRAL